ncbi:MAG: hypothetical protein K1X79_05925 [Oligoflexia bacterium]|nr:hypothetical protein [Oligoflexia bacterium]
MRQSVTTAPIAGSPESATPAPANDRGMVSFPEFLRLVGTAFADATPCAEWAEWSVNRKRLEQAQQGITRLVTCFGELEEASTALAAQGVRWDGQAALRQLQRTLEDAGDIKQSRIIVAEAPRPSLDRMKAGIHELRVANNTGLRRVEDVGGRFFAAYHAFVNEMAEVMRNAPGPVIGPTGQAFAKVLTLVSPFLQIYNYAALVDPSSATGPQRLKLSLALSEFLDRLPADQRLEASGGVAFPALLLVERSKLRDTSVVDSLSELAKKINEASLVLEFAPRVAIFFDSPVGKFFGEVLPNFRALRESLDNVMPARKEDLPERGKTAGSDSFTIGEYRKVATALTSQSARFGPEVSIFLKALDAVAEACGLGSRINEIDFHVAYARIAAIEDGFAKAKQGKDAVRTFLAGNPEVLTLDSAGYRAYWQRADGITDDMQGFPLAAEWSVVKTPERFRFSALNATEAEARAIALKELGLDANEVGFQRYSYGQLMRFSVLAREVEETFKLERQDFSRRFGRDALQAGSETYRESLHELVVMAAESPPGFEAAVTLDDLAPGRIEGSKRDLSERQLAFVFQDFELDWEPAELVDLISWKDAEERLQQIPPHMLAASPQLFELSNEAFATWCAAVAKSEGVIGEIRTLHAKPLVVSLEQDSRIYQPGAMERTVSGLEGSLARLRTFREQQKVQDDIDLAKMWAEEVGINLDPTDEPVRFSQIERSIALCEGAIRRAGVNEVVTTTLIGQVPRIAARVMCQAGDGATRYAMTLERVLVAAKNLGWDVPASLLDRANSALAPDAIEQTLANLRKR